MLLYRKVHLLIVSDHKPVCKKSEDEIIADSAHVSCQAKYKLLGRVSSISISSVVCCLAYLIIRCSSGVTYVSFSML